MNQGIIFDLDGTLVDSLPGIAASLNRTLNAHGLNGHSDSAVRRFVGDGLKTLVERASPMGTTNDQIESLISLFKRDYEISWQEGTKQFPGILNLLNELQKSGLQLAVLSNKVHEFTDAMVRSLFPSIHFQCILGQMESIPHKPHPAGAFRIAEQLGLAPAACTIVGDSSVDIETAINAEMHAIGVSWGYHDRDRLLDAGAQRIAETPTELTAMLVA